MEKKLNSLAGICSFFIPGLGQLAAKGEFIWGFILFWLTVLAYMFLIFPGFIVHAYVIYDALQVPKAKVKKEKSSGMITSMSELGTKK